jgi:glycosyltransferase involved in cell wall biosynthesis
MDIDVVIIGLNVETTLKQCIESVLNSIYPQGKINLFYVDGGSSDRSVSLAKSYSFVHVLELKVLHPTPGLGRNRGWQAGSSPLVQFLDGDMQIDPHWLERALQHINHHRVAAVRGLTQELEPLRSIYHWIAQQEWNGPPGECEAFGGDVLIKRQILEETGGYREELIAGEDPELSLRVRALSWKIIQLNLPMTTHDINMTRFSQYWKRGYRTGYGFAAVRALHPESPFWRLELFRIILRGGVSSLFFFASFVLSWFLLVPMLFVLLYPRLFKVKSLSDSLKISEKEASFYAWHCSFVVIPQFFGFIRYHIGKIFNIPLRNSAHFTSEQPID